MNQGAGTGVTYATLVSEYHSVSRQLFNWLKSVDVDSFENEKLIDLLDAREGIIAAFEDVQVDHSPDTAVQKLLTEISQMDVVVRHLLQTLHESTNRKIHGIVEQKRGVNAYNTAYSADAAFIDRKE